MSSRALRKAQREAEERRRQEENEVAEDVSQSEPEEDSNARTSQKPSLFALLGQDDREEEEESGEELDKFLPVAAEGNKDEKQDARHTKASQPLSKSAKSKKKKKKKASSNAAESTERLQRKGADGADEKLDEIDKALQELAMRKPQPSAVLANSSNAADASSLDLWKVLSVDTQHLHAANEMRRLFGRVALESANDENGGDARRRAQGAQQMGLAGAVAGRNQRGRGLASIGLRRNVFIQGKEEWPRGTSGGLGMEVVEKRPDGSIEYRFVHNSSYQDVQRQFATCVASMDPNRMVQLLQYNPFHISTLLQVSEIAKQERDHATSGDLLERALFSFGRSVHSTFSSSISHGTARLNFRRPENREFWLATWRYVNNLGMRATWRTAFEWAKLLLSLDPEGDPYCVALVIDQYAVRGRQPGDLVALWRSPMFNAKWQKLPSMVMSIGLAHVQAGEPASGRDHLRRAIGQYPWVAARMFQELEIDAIPPSIWGVQPPNPEAKLFTELYVTRAKDLWNTPEASSLLVEVASSADPSKDKGSAAKSPLDKLNYTRHTLLADNPALNVLLDRSLTSKLRSSSDPLPPADSLSSYDASRNPQRSGNSSGANREDMLREYSTLEAFFRSLLPWVNAGGDAPEPRTGQGTTEEGVERLLELGVPIEDVERRLLESGVPMEDIVERTERFQQLQAALAQLADEREPEENGEAPDEER